MKNVKNKETGLLARETSVKTAKVMAITNDTDELDFKALLEAAPALFLILKPDAPHFTILGASDAYLNATMTTRKQVTGKGLFEIFPDNPNDATADGTSNLTASLLRAIKTKAPDTMAIQKYDIQRPASEGGGFEVRYWSPLNSPVLNKNGEVEYIIHRADDVTKNVSLEKESEELKRNSATLLEEKNVHIRNYDVRINTIMDVLLKYTLMDFSEKLPVTSDGDVFDAIAVGLNTLVEELENHMYDLDKSNQELIETNNELDSFTYSVSHDLRAPLRAIHGFAKILEEDYYDKLGDDGRKTIAVILKNAKKMGDLIDDLLAFSRLGRKEAVLSEINMKALARNTASECAGPYTGREVNITVGQLPPAMGDLALIKQVWVNLISNAIKYSRVKPESVIEIGTSIDDNGNNVYFVRDNGAGFDMQYYDKLFGVFQRLHSQEEFEGTGVGLAIVDRIIRKHKGRVWAEAKVNEGACFYFSLPKMNL